MPLNWRCAEWGGQVIRDVFERGLGHHQAGRLEEAKQLYKQTLAREPRHSDALHLLGVLALQGGNAEEAIQLIGRAIAVQGQNPAYHANLAQAFLALQRIDDAQAAFQRAAALDPHNPQFATGVASCTAMQGKLGEAEMQLRAVVQGHPDFALAWFNLGNAVREQGRLAEAEVCYRRALEIEPELPDVHSGLGSVLHAMGRFEEAERAYHQHLLAQPNSATGYINLASVLIDRGKFDDAAVIAGQGIERTLGAAAGQPDLQLMLGSALAYQGKFIAALRAFRAAADFAPDHARAHWACGVALLETGNVNEALQQLARARELQPDSAEYRNGMAGVHLALGDLAAGWREYGWRPARSLFTAKLTAVRLIREAPGGVIAGRKICVWREQGLGDELFFLRFAAQLRARGAEITYCADAKIASLLERTAAFDRIIVPEEPLPATDFSVLVGDLPHLLGNTETPSHPDHAAATENAVGCPRDQAVRFPEVPPPLALKVLSHKLQRIEQTLAGLGPAPYLGLTWRAGTAPEQQRGAAWMLHKEVPLERLGSAVRGVKGTLLALQRHPKPGEIDEIAARAGRPVHDVTALNEELEAMLALLALIDEYVGVSNTNMHLRAGAGRTARVLVPRPSEWRWLLSGDESPWFPGFPIYRQGVDGDWSAAFDRLAHDLHARFGKR